jgi:hypothetical protein
MLPMNSQSIFSQYTIILLSSQPFRYDLDFLPLAPVSGSDAFETIKHLRQNLLDLMTFLAFITKSCTGIFVPVLQHVFNLSLS